MNTQAMQEPIELRYTEKFIRTAVRLYWRKEVGLTFPVATFLMTGFFFFQIAQGNRGWWIGVIGSLIFISIVMMSALYFMTLRRSLQRFKRMKTPTALLRLGEQRFSVESDTGKSEIEWSTIKKIWRFNAMWLLFFSTSEFMTLPTNSLPVAVQQKILDRAGAHGVDIV